MTDSRRPSLALSLVAVAATASLTGCSYFSPTQTESPYAPSDGVEVALSNDVQVQNLLLVGSAKGESGTLSGYAVNSTAAPVDISFAGADGATPIKATIPPGQGINLTDKKLTVPALSTAPGGMMQLAISTPASGAKTVQVPVLAATQEYATLLPSGQTPPPTAEATPAGEATSTEGGH